jgi:hypothetical protein
MKKQKRNSIDLLIENLSQQFSNIPNFHLVNTDQDANELFNFIVRRFGELNDFQTLYLRYYIPASSKSILDIYNELRKSVYRNVINVTKDDLRENYFETIRLGYVGLFHKAESFRKELIVQSNKHFNNHEESTSTIQKYILDKFSFNIEKDWKIEDIYIEKVNWICNCIKHRDGYPLLNTNCIFAYKFPKTEKIRIEKEEFKEDIEQIRDFYLQQTREIFLYGMYKSSIEMFGIDWDNLDPNNDKDLKLIENKEKMEESIRKLIDLKRKK